MQQLRGREGARVKRLYQSEAKRTGVDWTRRHYVPGDAFAAGDDVNRLLSAGNSCLYGACHAAIVGVGASPALGFVHTGNALSFVLDIADLYKAEFTIPVAFELAAAGRTDESEIRYELRDRFASGRFMQRVVRDVLTLILKGEVISTDDQHALWDERSDLVASGVNWSDDDLRALLSEGYLVVTGPDIVERPSEW